ncbi:sigma-70 family RNA polymerase sigma factor [Streptomyces sp. DSM 44915]|uniref:Sigma-70 family RNA polymerase sigma factor n=1 Tax=Streptomyces chisholmiae TaxID=3075540 RepID=A0ABU2JRW9_9ACTN|nr:sigma-70 family RNA polymerase sigma factor [Streptomyces sp. DSM 44915]MDT0267667.1 sigma-70 family RNA polymerase sigma factor [Streptomyces sp. DSM 44915]
METTATTPRETPEPPPAEQYRARLLRYVRGLTYGDSHRAEDIVQETMLRAWLADTRPLPDGEADGTRAHHEYLAAWLRTVARNLAFDAHRRERSLPSGLVPDRLLHQPADHVDMADRVADRLVVSAGLARLTPDHRAAVVQVHLRGRSGAEAARELGVPRGTVKSRVHYAVSALRREIGEA